MKHQSDTPISRRRVVIATAATALSTTFPQQGWAANKKITAAIGLDSYYATYVVAKELGLWEKAGIDFNFRQFDDGSLGWDAIATGNADLASATLYSLLQRVDKGVKLYPVAAIAASGTLFSIVARSEIKKPEDLIGKTVAFPIGGIAHFLFNQYAAKRNLPLDKIKQKNVPAPESIAAISRGDVDAFLLWEPWPTRAMNLVPGTHKLANLGDDGINVINWLAVGPSLIGDQKSLVSILKVLNDASNYIQNNKKEAIQITSKTLRLPQADVSHQIENINYSMDFSKDRVMSDYNALIDFALQVGRIKSRPNAAEIIHPEFIKLVDPKLATGW
mgnify:CR=1 FL=1|jgi:ABC-type nitrate/sulfonate/bicarbonate transport system substrate-binding protein